jgi:chemotaxis protein CheD
MYKPHSGRALVKRLDAAAANTVASEELSIVSRRAAPQPPPADDIELF